MLRCIVEFAATQPPEARPGDLAKAISREVPSNKAERGVLLDFFGYLGILQPASKPAPFERFVAAGERVMPQLPKSIDGTHRLVAWPPLCHVHDEAEGECVVRQRTEAAVLGFLHHA